ncbi:MAG: S8 family serine peptidase [Bifidobacterium longum]|uniref:S8 family serine peptidase n=1 Tax=Bifidobacterium longum TaxID=216816 RepID=UPI003EC0D7FF|nr:S8 family serine peptidase [Bifidobacterium longum]MBS6514985.1 S8 family serine peptidase [Bifidobacterium longum]
MKRYTRRLIGAAVAVVMAGTVCTPVVMADDADSSASYWYVDNMGVRDAWKQDITGKGVKVAVIDSQVVSDYPGFADANISYKAVLENGLASCTAQTDQGVATLKASDSSLKAGERGIYATHGTEMVARIVGNGAGYDGSPGIMGVAPGAEITAYADGVDSGLGGSAMDEKCKDDDGEVVAYPYLTFSEVIRHDYRIINMSFGSTIDGGPDDVAAYVSALRKGIILVSGRDNDTDPGTNDFVGMPLNNSYFPGEITVNSINPDGSLSSTSDVMDGNVAILSPGTNMPVYPWGDSKDAEVGDGGTSSATAILSGYLALVLQKWPKATGNQVLQSLIRNTKGNESGEPRLDPEHKRGFGEVDVAKLLSVDPTQYPDINPLLAWAYETSEKHEETRGMYTDHSDWKHDYGATDPFSPDGERINATKNTDLVGREYERQQAAWKKVEQCKSDGGSDCMKYSATNTADKADGKDGGRTVLPDTGGSKLLGVPLWVWLATGGVGIAVVIGGIVLAVVLSKRGRRRSRHGGHAAGRGPLPPVNPYPPQVPGANNGMVPPPAAGQYAPQQQVPYPTAFPQQYGQGQPVPQYRVPSQTPQASTQRAPYSAAPVAMPPQQAAQPTVIPDNTQNPHTNNNR